MFLLRATSILCFISLIALCKSDCKASVKSFKNIIVLDQNNNIQYSNDGEGNIVKRDGEFIILACPGSTLKSLNVEKKLFKCIINDFTPKISGVTCNTIIQSSGVTRKIHSKEKNISNCNGAYDYLQIGFEYSNGAFIPQIDLCWDDKIKRTLWTNAKLQKQLTECPSDPKRPSWYLGKYFDETLAEKYTKKEQRLTLDNIFHHNIPTKLKDIYLEKGHMVAKCDFMYEVQQQLTFHYINAAPQWGSFNKANWKNLESQLRTYATNQSTDLDVYTGTNGILQVDGHEYYLDYNNKTVPVPIFFWKVIIRGKLGVAIIGSNDIFSSTIPYYCTNILDQITWLQLKSATNKEKGYITACSLPEFMKIDSLRNELPSFPTVTGVLK